MATKHTSHNGSFIELPTKKDWEAFKKYEERIHQKVLKNRSKKQ